jgi:hypothetical protein
MSTPLSNNDLDKLAIEADTRQGERMIGDIYDFLGRFVSYPSEHAHVAHALWCVHTHLMHWWDSTPRLAFLSPEPASGKSRALEVTELLVPRPMEAVNMSASALFRSVGSEDGLPTILFDEIDTVFGPKAKENEDIRGLLNAGHRRGKKTYRTVVIGKKFEVEAIEAFCAVAVAGLGSLPDSILTRSVIIRMRPRHAGEHVDPFRRRLEFAAGNRIREAIEAWARSAQIELNELPNEIQDRDADAWESLIAVADAIGGQWPVRARRAAVSLVADSKDAEASLGVRLLADLKLVFGDCAELPSKAILAGLLALPEAPWGDLRGKALDERSLARRLRAYQVKPKTIRTGPSTCRGYIRADLEDQWLRYLSPLEKSETGTTTETQSGGGGGHVTSGAVVSDVSDVSGKGATTQAAVANVATDDLRIPDFLDRRHEQEPETLCTDDDMDFLASGAFK